MDQVKERGAAAGRDVHEIVQRAYASVAKAQGESCCGSGCCAAPAAGEHPVPEAELGLSCGNPLAFSLLKEGDTVLDLGSGAGKDVFLAAQQVGASGKAIGVDMTPEMLSLAERNSAKFARSTGLTNVEFRAGRIEALPVADASVDAVISNCVINLSPDKAQVFREAHRVLRPGGSLIVSDIVLERELPQQALDSELLYAACISGAAQRGDYLDAVRSAGFSSIEVLDDKVYDAACACIDPITSEAATELAGAASSITIRAVK